MTAPMSANCRSALLNFLYDTDHLTWLYRCAVDRSHDEHCTSEHTFLVDYANRAASLARSLLDEDNRRRDVAGGFKPAPSVLRQQLRATLHARRRAVQQRAAPAAGAPPTSDAPPVPHPEPPPPVELLGAELDPSNESGLRPQDDEPERREDADRGFWHRRRPR